MAFSILNTPKKLGNSLLRRGTSKKTPAKVSPNPRSGTRRSPRIATTTAGAATAATTPRAKGKVTQYKETTPRLLSIDKAKPNHWRRVGARGYPLPWLAIHN